MTRYTFTARCLHWLIALMLTVMVVAGLYMKGLPLSPLKLQVVAWHKWAGVSVFVLVVLRLLWRAGHPPPPAQAQLNTWQSGAARFVHATLYILMLVIPVSGWLMSSALGVQTVWFGVLELPDLLQRNRELARSLQTLHEWLNRSLMALVALHVLAVIKHQFIDRDNTLSRMLFSLSRRK